MIQCCLNPSFLDLGLFVSYYINYQSKKIILYQGKVEFEEHIIINFSRPKNEIVLLKNIHKEMK